MKTSEYQGFTQVFRFTLFQFFRNKAFLITMLILIFMPMLAIPVYTYTQSVSNGNNPVEKIYVINESGMTNLPYEAAIHDETRFVMEIEETKKDYETLKEEIIKEHSNEIILTISRPEMGPYMFSFASDPKSNISQSDVMEIATAFTSWFETYKVSILNAPDETLALIKEDVSYELLDTSEYLSDKKVDVISQDDYNVVYFLLMMVFFVIVVAGSNIATKVAEEKANRIVEFLMTTIRPRALILGKVAAALVASITEIILTVFGALLSNYVSCKIFGTDSSVLLAKILPEGALEHFTIPNILICILIMILGIFIFGLLYGLFGASISKMEELQQGLSTTNFILIVTFLASIAAANMMWTIGTGGFVTFCLFFPLTSALLLPGAVMIGETSLLMTIGSIAILVIFAFLMLNLVASVYEIIIVMNGNPISAKQMIQIYKERRKKK